MDGSFRHDFNDFLAFMDMDLNNIRSDLSNNVGPLHPQPPPLPEAAPDFLVGPSPFCGAQSPSAEHQLCYGLQWPSTHLPYRHSSLTWPIDDSSLSSFLFVGLCCAMAVSTRSLGPMHMRAGSLWSLQEEGRDQMDPEFLDALFADLPPVSIPSS